MNKITVLGASGFIGSHLVNKLKELQIDHYAPRREEDISEKYLGDIFYCIGLTSNFRTRSFDTVNAHVCKLHEVLKKTKFDSLMYLSSTYLYKSSVNIGKEDDEVAVNPLNYDDLYNISKLMGESLALSCKKKTTIVRLSNVYGGNFSSNNFLHSIIKDAILKNKVILKTSFDSEKDYINVMDTIEVLIKIMTNGKQRIYNVASGKNVNNYELIKKISELTGCEVEVLDGAKTVAFREINISRIQKEFNFKPSYLLDNIEELIKLYRNMGVKNDSK